MRSEYIEIKKIDKNDVMYPRQHINNNAVLDYAKAMKLKDNFPSPIVCYFNNKIMLIDGRHRLEAMEINGEKYVRCDVNDSIKSEEDLFTASVKANLKHGVRYTLKDKEKIIGNLKHYDVDSDKISKMLHMNTKNVESIGTRSRVNSELRKLKNIPVIKDVVNKKESINIVSKAVEQEGELLHFLNFISNTTLLRNDNIKQLIINIKKKLEEY
jgi:hypothetical protein